MSFAERHKIWLLPLLILAAVAVLWHNLSGGAAPAAPPPADEFLKAAPAPAPAPDVFGADLQALAVLPPAAADPAPLLTAGRQPLPPAALQPTAPPRLHPQLWAGLWRPPAPPRPAPAAGPAPRRVDFLFAQGDRQEAWMGGRPYRPGADLGGGYTLRRLTASGAVAAGPAGDVAIPLNAQPAPSALKGSP